jgi:hypothetical protein
MTHNSQRHPDISVSVKIELKDAQRSNAILNALIPDNHNFPKGLSLSMSTRGSLMRLRLQGNSIPVETLVGTLDEILEHISLCQKVMQK